MRSSSVTVPTFDSEDHLLARVEELEREQIQSVREGSDRHLVIAFFAQWVAVVAVALIFTPRTWIGSADLIHLHLWIAIGGGALLSVPPWLIARAAPGALSTRLIMAFTQSVWSALFIHMSGGRIETHFHVFVSLVLLSFYRDVRVLLVATAGVAIDHALRGIFWPESVFGIVAEAPYRWIEHAAWVLVEVGFLYYLIQSSLRAMRESADSRARYEQHAETRIAQSEAALNRFLETAPFFVGELELANDEIYFLSGNRSAIEFFAADDHERSLFAAEGISQWRKGLRAALEQDGNSEFTTLAQTDPKPCWLTVTVGLLSSREGVHRFCFIAHDVTERAILISELESAKIEAEGASRAKSEFLMNMSHEIRTPLNGIAAGADILTDPESTPDEREEFGGMIRSNTAKLTDILEDIFTLSSVDAGMVTVERKPFRVDDLLHGLADDYRSEAEAKGLQLHVQAMGGVVVLGDEVRVRQALRQLVSNAVKFTSEGSVDLSASFEEQLVTLTVRDSGPGIPGDQVSMLFEPFTQADGSLTRQHGGTGVGLAVVDRLARLLGGRVDVESRPGEGSSFRLSFAAQVTFDAVT